MAKVMSSTLASCNGSWIGPVKPMLVMTTKDMKAPTMKMSPWAKLMSSMMP